MHFEEERMNEGFVKYHVRGFPFHAVYHKFDNSDVQVAHDHPWNFTTLIVKGGYVERIYHINDDGSWWTEDLYRNPGTSHYVGANHIHEIISLPEGECWTHILPHDGDGIWRFWDFRQDGIYFREHTSSEWIKYKP